MKYRSSNILDQMELIEYLLTAISEKKATKLDVAKVLQNSEAEMPYNKAIQIAMQETANKSMVAVKALAIGCDRLVAMVEQMADEMGEDGNQNGERYRERLDILTNFKRIMDELNPEMANKFAQM